MLLVERYIKNTQICQNISGNIFRAKHILDNLAEKYALQIINCKIMLHGDYIKIYTDLSKYILICCSYIKTGNNMISEVLRHAIEICLYGVYRFGDQYIPFILEINVGK